MCQVVSGRLYFLVYYDGYLMISEVTFLMNSDNVYHIYIREITPDISNESEKYDGLPLKETCRVNHAIPT